MKKLLVFVLIVVMVFSVLAGCSSSGTPSMKVRILDKMNRTLGKRAMSRIKMMKSLLRRRGH